MNLSHLPTPSLLLDRLRLQKNVRRMRETVEALGVDLRPHLKTCKSADVARQMTDGFSGAITVSTLAEARYFLAAGYRDILYAVGIAPNKLDAVAALMADGADLKIILDDPTVAEHVAKSGVAKNLVYKVLIEFDCDGHRAGLEPDDPALLRTAQILDSSAGCRFEGIMTHAGASYDCKSAGDIRAMAQQEWQTAAACAETLRQAGLVCPTVSVGSTPTTVFASPGPAVTEVRAGVYAFYDLFQANLGVCSRDDIALSVLASVISHKPDKNRLIIDAGALALSKDRGTASQQDDCGYGLVCDGNSGALIDDLVVDVVNQEHGVVTSRHGPIDYDRYPIGSLLRVLPNHACMTAAAYDRYQLIGGGNTETWGRCGGW